MSFLFTNVVKDKEGTGNKLLQWSYISLKQDALHWLRENGRLPSADIEEYFQEIKERNDYKMKYEAVEEKNQTLEEEKEELKKEQEANHAEILALKA